MDKLADYFINILFDYIWNNTIVLRCSLVMLLIIIFIIYQKRTEVYNALFPITYDKLCLKIGTILNKNKNLFREFGPNSSINSEKDPIKQDLKLWRSIKTNEILPNNKEIRNLIEDNDKIISSTDKSLFQKMLNHIIAFEAHCLDESIDYRNFQFPIEFEKFIYLKCEYLNRKQIEKITKWIKNKFLGKKSKQLEIKSVCIFGSIFKAQYKDINDIDILIFSEIFEKKDILKFAISLEKTKKEFACKFKKELNCTLFTKSEKNGYKEFLEKIDIKKEL